MKDRRSLTRRLLAVLGWELLLGVSGGIAGVFIWAGFVSSEEAVSILYGFPAGFLVGCVIGLVWALKHERLNRPSSPDPRDEVIRRWGRFVGYLVGAGFVYMTPGFAVGCLVIGMWHSLAGHNVDAAVVRQAIRVGGITGAVIGVVLAAINVWRWNSRNKEERELPDDSD